jgi:hypothetical protein
MVFSIFLRKSFFYLFLLFSSFVPNCDKTSKKKVLVEESEEEEVSEVSEQEQEQEEEEESLRKRRESQLIRFLIQLQPKRPKPMMTMFLCY